MNTDFSRKPCRVIRLSRRQQDQLGIAESNRMARAQFEQRLIRDERLARERGMRAAASYNHKIDVARAQHESLWLRLTAAVSLGLFLLMWSLWA